MKAGIKAAIVATTAAASLVAVSPLAFAGEDHHDGRGHHSHHDGHDGDDDDDYGHHDGGGGGDQTECAQDNSVDNGRGGGRGGLINISDVNVQVPVQACGNDILSGVLGILSSHQRNGR